MNPNAAQKGRSFKGVIIYIIHDPDQAESDERVLFTETRNLRTDDPEKAAKVMAYTALHAGELKAAAGHKATGRKTDSPVYHLSLSWIPGEKPTQAEMMEAGTSALKALGFDEHEAVFAGHGDKEHMHLHIVTSRIHPVTGLTHNPKDDHKILQRWGHEYDKARGQEHRSPIRAAKHEKDKALKAVYQEQAKAAQQRKGAEKTSKVRPEWKAEKGATHPKSQKFQDIKATYAARVKELSAASRDTTARHKAEWQDIRTRQAEERAALLQSQARGPRACFNQAAGRDSLPDTRQQYAALKTSQRIAQREQETAAREKNAGKVGAFLEKQRNERRAFARQEKVSARRAARNLHLATATPVGQQGQEHRGHLAGRFNRDADKAAREAGFADRQRQEKAAFFDRLAAQDRPQVDALRARHVEESRALRAQGKAARAAALPSARQRRDRAAMALTHRDERNALRDRQEGECAGSQERWASLNVDRASAWDAYRQHRAGQEATRAADAAQSQGENKGAGLKDIYQQRASHFDSRQTESRPYAGTSADAGRERSLRKP